MKLVIDTNIVISALIKDGNTREIIVSGKFELVSPDFVLEETYKYEGYICEKAGLTKDEFELLMALIFQKITVVPSNEYEARKGTAKKIMKQDIKDVPYVACYLALKCDGIWTNDDDYEDVKEIEVVSTSELSGLLQEGNEDVKDEKP